MSSAIDKLKHHLSFLQNPESFKDALGLSDSQCVQQDYGKERGAYPVLSEAQRKAVRKLASRIKKTGFLAATLRLAITFFFGRGLGLAVAF